MVESEYDLAHIVLDYSDFTGKDIEIYDCKQNLNMKNNNKILSLFLHFK